MPPSLVSGQIAINEADGKLFYRNGSGAVTQLATGGGGGGTELFPYANTASFPATGATTALYLSIASGRVYQWNGSVYSEVGPVGGGGSLSATVTIPASGDQYWSNTQLLLRGDTAVDSSSYARTVTAYGGATVSTSQKKFGGGALSFAAVGDYYLVPSSADLSFDTGDFTMEAWVRPTAFPVENGGAFISSFLTRQAPGGHGWRFELRGTSSSFTHLSFTGMSDNGAGEQTVMVSYSFSLNQWYHVAASRVGGVIYLFVDGVLQNTGGTSFGIFIQNASSDIRVGSLNFDSTYKFQFVGQIDDARITKGTGRYAASFTPPTEAYGTGTYVAAQTLPVVGTGSIGSGLSWSSVPAAATATGTSGQIAYDRQYQYICVATNTWARISLDAFRPTSIAGIQLWLDASDPWTLFNATSGGSNVAADGTVARWEDKSGNARHATESTNGPTRKAAVVGGSDALRFTGAQFLAGATTPASGNVRTFFAVVRKLGTPSDVFFQFGTKPSSGGTLGYIARASLADGNSSIGGDITTNNLTIQGEELTFTNAFVSSYVQSSASSTRYFFNGIEKTVTGSVGSYNMDPGYFVGKCRNVDDIAFFDGYMCELIAYDTALSDANRALVQSYLTAKWGIT